jgi:hypothetical protein
MAKFKKLLKIIKKFNNKFLHVIIRWKSNKYRKFQKAIMSKIVKCPSCDCHIVVNDKGQKEFCIKNNSM